MRAVIQRVSNAQVVIDHKLHAEIKNGLSLLVGIEESDSIEDVLWLTKKIIQNIFYVVNYLQVADNLKK